MRQSEIKENTKILNFKDVWHQTRMERKRGYKKIMKIGDQNKTRIWKYNETKRGLKCMRQRGCKIKKNEGKTTRLRSS